MPVGTDAILLAAWVRLGGTVRILDVGTGSGVLSLIMAQRSPTSLVDAIDSSEEASSLARMNFQKSPFATRLRSTHADWNEFTNAERSVYDIIVSNPPFFERSLRSDRGSRTRWRHVRNFGFDSLLESATKILAQSGRINVIIPFLEPQELGQQADSYGLEVVRYCRVIPVVGKRPRRILTELSRPGEYDGYKESSSLTVRDQDGKYHPDYLALAGSLYVKPLK